MRHSKRLGRLLQVFLLLALAAFPAQQVIAQGQTPPPATGRSEQPALVTAPMAVSDPVLYQQMDAASPYWVSSQDSTDNRYDTQAADDFFISPTANSWQITAVDVVGHYYFGSGAHSIYTATVRFYTDSGGRPDHLLYSALAHTTAPAGADGTFSLPLNPVVNLASNTNYWISVQALQTTSWFWAWYERTTLSHSAAVWQNPNNGFAKGCLQWTPVSTCFPGTGPDMLFRLYGTQSTNRVTPVLLSLNPDEVANRTFTLTVLGAGFATGATVDWTLGTTKHIATTVTNPGRLTASVPAADVSSFGAVVTVTVTNPGPCVGSCTSNALTFRVRNPIYMPFVRR